MPKGLLSEIVGIEEPSAPPRASLADIVSVEPPVSADGRSLVARGYDLATTPLVSDDMARSASGAILGLPGTAPPLQGSAWDAIVGLSDILKNMTREPVATARGLAGGVVEGAATLTSPIDLALAVTGTGRLGRMVQQGVGAATALRGAERLATARSLPEAGAGLAEVGLGAVGVHTASPRVRPQEARPIVGHLPPHREVIIPPAPPDPSLVRGVPAQYAQREPLPPSRQLPAGRPAIVTPPPVVVDPSGVRSVPAAVMSRDFEGRTVTRKVYSSDITAADAPFVQLTEAETRELRRMAAELDAMPFTKRSFVEAGAGRGGDLEVVPGGAGAPVYTDVIQHRGAHATRAEVQTAIERTLEGHHSAIGQDAIEVARKRLQEDRSVSRPMLPPEAGDLQIARMDDIVGVADDADNPLDRIFADVNPETVDYEPGMAGKMTIDLAARAGGAVVGGTVGAASGEDTRDRVQRGVVGAVAGALAPTLLARSGGRVLDAATRIASRSAAGTLATSQQSPIRAAGAIPKAKLFEFPSIQKMPEPIRDEVASVLADHGGFASQRRNVQSVERTHALAERLEVPLRQLRPGKALNAEELVAYRDALASVMTERVPLAEKIRQGGATDLEKLEFSRLTDRATVLVASYRGAKAETGRALNILRTKARVLDYGDTALIEQAIKAPGFDGDIKQLADAVTQAAGDPVKQLELLREASSGTRFQKAQAAYYNSLLSGVKTHLRNAIGNSFNVITNLATPLGAAPVDAVRSRAAGQPRTVYIGEIPQAITATFTAMPRALRDAAFTLQHGFTPANVARAAAGQFDAPRVELPGGMLPNLPSRALEASDVFFRSLARHQELYAGAYAQVRREGLTRSRAIQERMAELIAGDGVGSRGIRERAETFAARAVFQERPGAFVQKLLSFKADEKIPVGFRAAATFVGPFIKTPGAILKQGAEFSPAGFAMKAARQGGREGAQGMGRAALGSISLAPIAYLAATGQLSGNGPTDAGEREALYEKGWMPNAVKVGNQWIRYQLFQPLSVPMAAVANAWERFSESDRSDRAAEESFTKALTGATSSFLDQSFLAGLNGLIDAINDPDRNAQRFLSLFAQGMVPGSGLLRNVSQAIDPVVRKPASIGESVKTIIPGLSQTVPARQTRFGEAVVRPGGPMRRGFIVPEVSEEKADPVADTLQRLGVSPQVPRARLVRDGQAMALTREQAQTIEKAIGRERRARLVRVMQSPRYANLPETNQRTLVERTLADVTRDVNSRAITRIRRNAPLTIDVLAPTASAQP